MYKVILYIDTSSSRCGHCGCNADPYELAHDMVVMEGQGCGKTFTHVAETCFVPWDKNYGTRMRPDLNRLDTEES